MNLFTVLAWGFLGFTALTQIALLLLWLEERRDHKKGAAIGAKNAVALVDPAAMAP